MIKVFDPGVNGVKGTVYEIAPLVKKYGLDGIALPASLLSDPAEAISGSTKRILRRGMSGAWSASM